MGIISGILCVICFCLLSAKAATTKLHLKKLDKILMKMHKPISALLIILCLVHIFCVFSLFKNRSLAVIISGIANIVIMISLICFCHKIKDRKKKILWHRIWTILMAVCIMGHFAAYIIDFNQYQMNIANIEIQELDLENVEDGVYIGACDAGYIYAKVKVEMKDGEIVSLNLLEHRNERGKRAENIIDIVLSEQKIDVDVISSATNSSNVIKKAIENAVKTPNKF